MSGVRPRRLPGALGGGLFWRTFLLIAALTLANLLADLAYGWANPQVRLR